MIPANFGNMNAIFGISLFFIIKRAMMDKYRLFQIILKEMGCFFMKKETGKFKVELWKMLASLAMVITTISVNTTCMFEYYQPKLPQGSEKLRRD